MTITREQIDEIIRDQIELECYDWDAYRIIGRTEAVDEILALIEKERDPLVDELVTLFEWSDTSYLHALMHVKNAVLNERATASAKMKELDTALRNISEMARMTNMPQFERLAAILGVAELTLIEISPPTPAA